MPTTYICSLKPFVPVQVTCIFQYQNKPMPALKDDHKVVMTAQLLGLQVEESRCGVHVSVKH